MLSENVSLVETGWRNVKPYFMFKAVWKYFMFQQAPPGSNLRLLARSVIGRI